MKGIVDRIEGQFVVIEIEGVIQDVRKEHVAAEVATGDVLVFKGNKWHKDEQATEERSKEIRKLMDRVWED